MNSFLNDWVLTLIVAAPVVAGTLLFFVPADRKSTLRAIGIGSALFTTVLTAWLCLNYDQAKAGFQFVQRIEWVPSLGISYQVGVDGMSVAMTLLTTIVFLAGSLVSRGIESRTKDFYVLLCALVAGVFGVFISLDLFFFYFFYELAVVPMYLLIGYWGSTNREYATMKLTLYLTAGAVVALIGLLLMYVSFGQATGKYTFDYLAMKSWVDGGEGFSRVTQLTLFPLLLIGFATIAPMWPLHSWSPGGHAAAPAAASMMHAGVLMKLGSYAILRIALPLMPEGAVHWLPWVAVLCCFNIIYGGYVAMNQRDMKFVIGYSSSSHMGYVLLGIASLTVLGTSGAVFLMFAHGVMTALAFALIGYFYDQTHTRQLDDLGGMMQQIPFVGVLFVMTAMASLGLPGFANFASEMMVIVGSWERYPIPTILALFGLVIGATYLLRTVRAAFLGPRKPRWDGLKDARTMSERAPFILLVGVLLAFGCYPAPLVKLIETGVAPIVKTVLAAEAGMGADVAVDMSRLYEVFGTEALLAALALVLIMVDLVKGRGRLTGPAEAVRLTAFVGLIAILVHSFLLDPAAPGAYGTLDTFALYWKRFFVLTALAVLGLSGPYEARLPAGRGEFPALVVFTTMGMCLLASVSDFVTLFVGLEIVTVTTFLLAAWRSQLPRSIEAGIKFVVIGALAAAFMVYGIAWIYGATGHFDFASVRAALDAAQASGGPSGALKFGLLLVLVGLGFKIGAVPFHVWIPDVYQGAPTPVTAFLSVGSKGAGVVLLMRFCWSVLGISAIGGEWLLLLGGLSALTLLMGNLGAIPQTDLKRFLGYSGIAHAGFLLMALATHTPGSAGAILFYVLTYLFANMAAFLVVIVVSRTADNAHMDRVNGLADRSPFLAFVLTVALLSLAGVPPLAGFFAKWMVLRAAIERPELLWLVILSGVMIVVSLYYYLCVIKRMYMRSAVDDGVLEVSGGTRFILLGCALATVIFGVWQGPLVEAARVGAESLR